MESERRRRDWAGCVNCITVKDKVKRLLYYVICRSFNYQFINEAPLELLGVFRLRDIWVNN